MYGFTLNEHYWQRNGENMEKDIQLPNQSLRESDSINRGKMQYQTALKLLWLMCLDDWFCLCNNEFSLF